jgi:acetyl-CoA decarbonylase/synthase complex subunit gamma
MGLTGLEIYKQLPKQNCKECGVPTCLAFAMKVAGGQAGLDGCPRLDDSARAALQEASAPPQRLVTVGVGEHAVSVGRETVLFRHEERFHNPCGIAVRVEDTLDDDAVERRLAAISRLVFDRMGASMSVDLIAVDNASGDAARFVRCVKKVRDKSPKPLILISPNAACLDAAGAADAASRPLLQYSGAADGLDAAIAVAKRLSLPLGLQNASLETLAEMVERARQAGLQDLVISPGQGEPAAVAEFLTRTRRAALKKKFRPFGYPALAYSTGDSARAVVAACWYVLKYAGFIVIDTVDPAEVLALLTTRANAYTDPQKPVQVEAKLYPIGEPGPNAPLLVTTNFALSYYSVESEVEASRIPAYILAVDTEGTSVLTAWAADKFNPETISKALVNSGAASKLAHGKVVIPGLVAVISGGLEEESGWKVEVGPKEAVGLVPYLTSRWKK